MLLTVKKRRQIKTARRISRELGIVPSHLLSGGELATLAFSGFDALELLELLTEIDKQLTDPAARSYMLSELARRAKQSEALK